MDKVENSAAAVRKSCGIGYREALKAKEKRARSMFAPAWSLVCVVHLAPDIVRSGRTSRDHSPPSIAPNCAAENIYLVEDCLGSLGCVWREADIGKTDLETVIVDLMAGNFAIRAE